MREWVYKTKEEMRDWFAEWKISMVATRVAVQGIGEVSWWGRVEKKKRKQRKPSMMERVIIIPVDLSSLH
jgi:hypothetical protein